MSVSLMLVRSNVAICRLELDSEPFRLGGGGSRWSSRAAKPNGILLSTLALAVAQPGSAGVAEPEP